MGGGAGKSVEINAYQCPYYSMGFKSFFFFCQFEIYEIKKTLTEKGFFGFFYLDDP